MKISLVTGSGGFIGKTLIKRLEERGDFVIQITRDRINKNYNKRSKSFSFNILDKNEINRIFLKYKPDEVYHLAAQSSPQYSYQNPLETFQINYIGTRNILDASVLLKKLPSVLIVSSSSVYAPVKKFKKISELHECSPSSPYGFSKLAAENLSKLYFLDYGDFPIFNIRPFFIIGPEKYGDVCSDWARNIVQIEQGKKRFLTVGNINNIRDFLHVDDAVNAMISIISSSKYGETFNICSGRGYQLKNILKLLVGLSSRDIKIKVDLDKIRSHDNSCIIGDNSKLRELGWKQNILIKNTISDILKYWRSVNYF
jgi:GDP-4-dehydro-6-deoxy-D-mannose reductase